MRALTLIIAIACVALVSVLAYRTFFRSVDPLPASIVGLTEHFNKKGILVQAFPVRHGFSRDQVLAVASLRIRDFPLAITVVGCPSDAAAEMRLKAIKANPKLTHATRNGSLVMYLPMWEEEEPMAQRIVPAFQSYGLGPNNSFKPKPLRGSA